MYSLIHKAFNFFFNPPSNKPQGRTNGFAEYTHNQILFQRVCLEKDK